MSERHQPGRIQRRVQNALLKAGDKELGHKAVITPDSEVRKAGARRLSRHAAEFVVGGIVGAASLVAIDGALDREDRALQQRDRERAEAIADAQDAETHSTLPHVRHTVEAGENPSTIADEYNVRPQDAQLMAEDIQARYADENGYIHPGQEIDITPPHEEMPSQDE